MGLLQAISYLLVSAAIGGFIITDDKRGFFGKTTEYIDTALKHSNTSATLLFLGFICSAISSVISSYKLTANRSSGTA